ncbi:MAG: hypothetical protein IKN82_02310 [Treponema sp.]|nr:hypothetical protein [Treponema sp.]
MEQKEFDSRHIQQVIGYEFKNIGLLTQAFTRKSYAQEHPGIADNEVLEFYGDAALNAYLCQRMYNAFGKIEKTEYISEKSEGELSEIRSWFARKENLANCIKNLELGELLFISSSDEKNGARKSNSVCEDLFEAIVGAVAIDSNWNNEYIKNVCEKLFSASDFYENYVEKLEEECRKHGWELPIAKDDLLWPRMQSQTFISHHILAQEQLVQPALLAPFSIPNVCVSSYNNTSDEGRYSFDILNIRTSLFSYNPTFKATKSESKRYAAKLYYEWILRRDKIIKVISKIDPEHAASQIHELQQKGLIKEPSFKFSESHDKNGNPIWRCTCKLVEAEMPIQESDISKKAAKQKAAAEALSYFIGKEITLNKSKEEN